jgi:hypothetical protein
MNDCPICQSPVLTASERDWPADYPVDKRSFIHDRDGRPYHWQCVADRGTPFTSNGGVTYRFPPKG